MLTDWPVLARPSSAIFASRSAIGCSKSRKFGFMGGILPVGAAFGRDWRRNRDKSRPKAAPTESAGPGAVHRQRHLAHAGQGTQAGQQLRVGTQRGGAVELDGAARAAREQVDAQR